MARAENEGFVDEKVVTVGELTLDDVVVEGERCDWSQPGGGALYSAIGARLWGAEPAVNATIGSDYPQESLDRIAAAGIDLSPVTVIDGPSLSVWLLYERGGRRHHVEKESGSSFAELDAARRPWTDKVSGIEGLHIAPQTTEGQVAALTEACAATSGGKGEMLVTQDVMIEPFISGASYYDGSAMRGATAFLPSAQEVRQIWGDISPTVLFARLRAAAGIEHLVIKHGKAGVDVINSDAVNRIPTAVTHVADATGAGDAFCGGFLVGLLHTGDPLEAALRGSVSAALVVETHGALEAINTLPDYSVHQRATAVRSQLTRITT